MSGCDKTSVVACMIVATLFYGSMFAGVFSNHVDIASNFAGTYLNITHFNSILHTLIHYQPFTIIFTHSPFFSPSPFVPLPYTSPPLLFTPPHHQLFCPYFFPVGKYRSPHKKVTSSHHPKEIFIWYFPIDCFCGLGDSFGASQLTVSVVVLLN